jgi:hypothetical protein
MRYAQDFFASATGSAPAVIPSGDATDTQVIEEVSTPTSTTETSTEIATITAADNNSVTPTAIAEEIQPEITTVGPTVVYLMPNGETVSSEMLKEMADIDLQIESLKATTNELDAQRKQQRFVLVVWLVAFGFVFWFLSTMKKKA